MLGRDELRAAAREHVADGTNYSPEDLTVVVDTKVRFPTIGERYYRAKLLDPEKELHRVTRDDGDGSPVDLDVGIRDPLGNHVTGSWGWDDATRYCMFYLTVPGQYTVRIYNDR